MQPIQSQSAGLDSFAPHLEQNKLPSPLSALQFRQIMTNDTLRDERQDRVDIVAAIWATKGDTILHCVEHRDFQEFMKCRSGNAVFLAMNT